MVYFSSKIQALLDFCLKQILSIALVLLEAKFKPPHLITLHLITHHSIAVITITHSLTIKSLYVNNPHTHSHH